MLSLQELKSLFVYALPAIAIALLGLPLYVYLPTFYASEIGFGVFEVGFVLFIARFIDVLTDPIIGYLSDRYRLRKSLMFLGSIILLVGFYYLTHPSPDASKMWLFSFSVIVYTGWSLITVPYYAIASDIGESYHQNTYYASARELFNISGVLLALLIPYLFGVSENPRESLVLMFTTIAIVLPLSMLLFLLRVQYKIALKKLPSFRENIQNLLQQINTSKYLFGSFFLNGFANAIPATLFLLYVEHVLGEKQYTGLLLLLYFFSGIVALPLWLALSKRWSKKSAWKTSMLSATFFFAFVPFLSSGDLVYFTLITLLSGLSLGADMALPASMQADVAKKYSGTLFGLFTMLTKLSLAFGVGLTFSILALAGFDSQSVNQHGLTILSLLYGLAPVVLKLTAVAVLNRYRENHNQAT